MSNDYLYIDDPLSIRDGLFLASSRSYGEQYVEPFIRAKYNLIAAEDDSYDAADSNGVKYEIKSCKALLKLKKKDTLLERVFFENNNIETKRMISFEEATTAQYLAKEPLIKSTSA
jgi:hypothetical protein